MRFKVLKSSFEGFSVVTSDSIDAALREIFFFKGWESKEKLHAAIRKWAEVARPGDVFCTQVTAIVAVAVSKFEQAEDVCPHCDQTGLDYDEFDATEDGNVEQRVGCPHCGRRWVDVFILAEQRPLAKRG